MRICDSLFNSEAIEERKAVRRGGGGGGGREGGGGGGGGRKSRGSLGLFIKMHIRMRIHTHIYDSIFNCNAIQEIICPEAYVRTV